MCPAFLNARCVLIPRHIKFEYVSVVTHISDCIVYYFSGY